MKKCKYCGTTENLITRKFKNQNMLEPMVITQELCYDCRFKVFSRAQKGKVITEDQKKNLSKIVKEWHKSEKGKRKHSIGQKIRYQRKDEILQSQRNGKLAWENSEFKNKKSKELKEKWGNPEFKKNKSDAQSKYMKECWKDPEYRKSMCELSKKLWEDEEYKKSMSKKHKDRLKGHNPFKANGLKPTKPQTELFKLAKQVYPDALENQSIKTKVSRRYPDILIPSLKLIIEYDGFYWHNSKDDKKRDEELKEVGYKIIHYIDHIPSLLELFGDIRNIILYRNVA